MRGRLTIGLYNSYDPTRFREAHRRALARAGPLALAFDANLVTFGFPFPEEIRLPTELAEWVADSTSIGRDGGHLRELSASGRFQSFPLPGRGLPPQLGEPVLTTSRPDAALEVKLEELAEQLRGGRSLLLLFGLGPHGLPRKAAAIPKLHLDVSGAGISLETCTALGAVTGALGTLARQ